MRRGSSSGRAPWRPCGRRSRLAAPQRCRRRDRGPPTRARALGHAPALHEQQRHDCAEAIVRRRLDQVERVGGHQRASGPRTTFGAALRSTGLDALSSRTTACSSTWCNVTLTSATVPDASPDFNRSDCQRAMRSGFNDRAGNWPIVLEIRSTRWLYVPKSRLARDAEPRRRATTPPAQPRWHRGGMSTTGSASDPPTSPPYE